MSFCRNCSNQINENAVGCPKCGMDPHSEKKYCFDCGNSTNEKQVICTFCGISLENKKTQVMFASSHESARGNNLYSGYSLFTWVIALIAFFFPWVKYVAEVDLMIFSKDIVGFSYSGAKMGSLMEQFPSISTIIIPLLLFLFPIGVLGVILSSFVRELQKYKYIFMVTALIIVFYALIGILTMEVDTSNIGSQQQFGHVFNQITQNIHNGASFKTAWGIWFALISCLAGAYLGGLFERFIKK